MENSRLDDLRRRVRMDPASIAFAALAEELRRTGQYEEAIETCRVGLQRHPSYLSARVTLGRALLDAGQIDAARDELEGVVRSAPDNLIALKALEDVHAREQGGDLLPPAAPAVERVVLAGPRPADPAASADAGESLEVGAAPVPASASPVVARLERFLAAIDAARHA